MRIFPLLAGCAALTTLLPGAPLTRELGDGLMYFRVHTLPADLPTDEAARKLPCVLDLRYAHAFGVAGNLLGSWLKFHSATHTPVFVLVNSATAPGLLAPLVDADDIPGLLTIGVAGQRFHPDITVVESADDERHAYDALEHGTKLSVLTTDHPDKQRDDEASLARDRAPAVETDDAAGGAETENPAAKPKDPPEDLVLQRAIHLHRALRAMKRL